MNKRSNYLYDAVLFSAAFIMYAPSLRCDFVGDDLIYFIGNPAIERFDVRTILRYGAIGDDYLPLRDLSIAFDHLVWGGNPFGFHLMNVVLFGIAVVSVKHLFSRLNLLLAGPRAVSGETQAFLAALVFAVHPNHREVVYAVYNRGALLTEIFFILSSLLFINFMQGQGTTGTCACESPRRRYFSYSAALSCYVFALISREYGIILPLVLVLLIYFADKSKRGIHLIHTAPFFLTAAIFYGIYKEYAVAARFIVPSSESFLAESISKAAVAVKIVLFYLVRMVTSLGEFDFDNKAPLALISLGVVTGLLYVAFRVRRGHPHFLFGLIFYLICLIPVLNFFSTLPIVSPRYSFIACVGLFFILTVPYGGKWKLIPGLCVIFTLVWSFLTLDKTFYWKDNISFWEQIAARDETSYAYQQLGDAYYNAEQYEKALVAFNKVHPEPRDPKYHRIAGDACFQLGDYRCAVRSLEAAMAKGANNGSVALDLVKAYLKLGDSAGARRWFDFVRINFPEMKEDANIIMKKKGHRRYVD